MRRELARKRRRRFFAAVFVLALGALAASPGARLRLAGAARAAAEGAASAFSGREAAQAELTLPETRVYALQLGVYDDGDRAANAQRQIADGGVPCVVWQRQRMRIVCAAALSREALASASAGGLETYVIAEDLPEVRLRIRGTRAEIDAASALLGLPDALFASLQGGGALSDALARAEDVLRAARPALSGGDAGGALAAQLLASLEDWRALCERTQEETSEAAARQYASLTMATLCRELRAALLDYSEASAESAASAQRTPSAAAEAMPPA